MGKFNSGYKDAASEKIVVGEETISRTSDKDQIQLLEDILICLKKIEIHLSMVTDDKILDEDIENGDY